METNTRQIFAHDIRGDRQVKEMLSDLLIGLIVIPDPSELWLVSPWVSDFDLLDNRSDDWSSVEPVWGARQVKFSELLVTAIQKGNRLNLVTNHDEMNRTFVGRLENKLDSKRPINWFKEDSLHTKGFLSSSFFLSGSMNFTYSGTHRNQEQVTLMTDSSMISNARLEFESRYQK